MPFPKNTPTPDDLPGLSPQEIAGLPVELLAILQREIDERLKRDKAAKTRLDAALTVRYATCAAEERQVQSKDTEHRLNHSDASVLSSKVHVTGRAASRSFP
jgi:hypothetical protein